MLSAPIFVYSEKSAKEYLASVQINKSTNDLELLTLKGVEYSTEEDYFKVQNFFLTESFDNDDYFNYSASLLATTTNVTYVARWGGSADTPGGAVGYLSCAYSEETESAKTATLTFDTVSSFRSANTLIGASTVTLGSSITNVLSTARGNYLTGQNSYQNNPTFYPFSINPGGTSRSYGSNTNSVPSTGYIKEIRLISNASQPPATYSNENYTLNLKFDLWNGNQFVESKNIVLCNHNEDLSTINEVVHTITSEQDYFLASGVRFLNVRLVNVPISTGTETAATGSYSLILDTDATYYSTNNVNLTTQPFIESPVFLLKDNLDVEFSGFDSVTVSGVTNPNNGIEVEVKLSNTQIGLNSENYVRLGKITNAGSSTLYLRLDDPAYEKARTAKYIQIKFSGALNTATNTYLQSSFNKAITLNQINLNRKQVLANDFVDQFKFSNGYESSATTILFGPFNIYTDKVEEMPALGTYKVTPTATTSYSYKNFIGLNNVREGRLQFNFSNHDKIYYTAKGSINNVDASSRPTYNPSAAAITNYTNAPSKLGYKKVLVLKYDIKTAQLNDTHWNGCTPNYSNTLQNRYGFHDGNAAAVPGTEVSKTLIVEAGGSTYESNPVNGQAFTTENTDPKRYQAEFNINKTSTTDNFKKLFGFQFSNFREVVVYQNTTNRFDIIEASQTYWVVYGGNDPKSAYPSNPSDGTIGLWHAKSPDKYINTLESTNEIVVTSPQNITRLSIPAFTFDKYEGFATDGIARNFEARVLVNYYDTNNNVISTARVVKSFTESNIYETIIETPTDASSSKKVGFKLLLIPKDVSVVESLGILGANFSINGVSITKNKYLIPTLSYFNDVGVTFSSKPRIEYLDNASNTATKYKRYYKSIAVSEQYNLISLAGNPEEEENNPPLLRTEVIYGGAVSKPDGTDIVVEWSGKDLVGDPWSSWYSTTSRISEIDAGVSNSKYIRFKVTLIPTSDGRKAPVLDSVSVRFWPYSEPYVAYATNPPLTENISSLILTKFETKDVERDLTQLQLNVTIDDASPSAYTISDLDQEQNIMQEINSGDQGQDITVKTIFLHEDARLRDAKVDLFYTPA